MDRVFEKVEDYRQWRSGIDGTRSIGLVPTMGGLHEGHFTLIRRSLAENDMTAVTIFLNRVQFNDQRDFDTYPANFEQDFAALEEMGVDAVFAPSFEEMYPDGYRFKLSEGELSRILEGEHRPGHFDGVLTIVLKLFNIAQADRAYFGEKDWQQLQLVKEMTEAFFLSTEVVACPTAREESGLAMSSRNRRLSEEGLRKAALFHQLLNTNRTPEEICSELEQAGFEVEYVADRQGRRLGAVALEGVRLIDNVELSLCRVD